MYLDEVLPEKRKYEGRKVLKEDFFIYIELSRQPEHFWAWQRSGYWD